MPEGVQAYLRAVAAEGRQLLATSAFDVFIDPTSDHEYSNYAIPRTGAAPDADAVRDVIEIMAGAARTPRVEYLPTIAPEAEAALLGEGFEVQLRMPVMILHPAELQPVELPDGVALQELAPNAPRSQVNGLMAALSAAFGEPYDTAAAESTAARLLNRIAVLARADGEIAGGGMCLEMLSATTEIVGIGIAEPFRRRGIASAVTSELARLAFERGATTAFLTPGAEASRAVYARCGFRAQETMLHLVRRD